MELGGLVALELGRFERAATLLEGTLTLVQSHHGHPVNSPALVASIGYAHFKTGRATQAEEELSDALQQMASLQPEGDETTSLTAKWLSEVLQARGAKWESKKILAKYPPKAAPIQRRQSATVSFSDLVPRKKVR